MSKDSSQNGVSSLEQQVSDLATALRVIAPCLQPTQVAGLDLSKPGKSSSRKFASSKCHLNVDMCVDVNFNLNLHDLLV